MSIGKEGEDRAVLYLKEFGYEIVRRNFHSKFGEIDVIAQKDGVLHFVEVKATDGSYEAIWRITKGKMEKILKTVNYFMLQNSFTCGYQIDAIIVNKNKIEMVENISF